MVVRVALLLLVPAMITGTAHGRGPHVAHAVGPLPVARQHLRLHMRSPSRTIAVGHATDAESPEQNETGEHDALDRSQYLFTLRIYGARGIYSMSDMEDAYDAMADANPEGRLAGYTPGSGLEFSAYVDVPFRVGWTIGLGHTWTADEFKLCWYQGGIWFPGTHCGYETRVACRTLEVCGTRPVLGKGGDVRAFLRLSAGYAWAHMNGSAENVYVDANTSAPVLQASLGADLGSFWFLDPTLEAGVRYLRFGLNGGEVRGSGSTDMDAELLEFLENGSADFSGFFVRLGLTFRAMRGT